MTEKYILNGLCLILSVFSWYLAYVFLKNYIWYEKGKEKDIFPYDRIFIVLISLNSVTIIGWSPFFTTVAKIEENIYLEYLKMFKTSL